jgi:hypothetical protein
MGNFPELFYVLYSVFNTWFKETKDWAIMGTQEPHFYHEHIAIKTNNFILSVVIFELWALYIKQHGAIKITIQQFVLI